MEKVIYSEKIESLNHFRHVYGNDIRTHVVWDKIKKSKIETVIATKKMKLYHPWYSTGDWRDGKPARAHIGTEPHYVRVPAVKTNDYIIILDGNHRIKDMNPAFIVIDYIEVTDKEKVYFLDLFNPQYKI